MIDEASTKDCIKKAMAAFVTILKQPPEKRLTGMIFDIEGTENTCRFKLAHTEGDPPEILTLSINVFRTFTDRTYTHYVFSGTEEEYVEYATKPLYDCDDFYESVKTLSASVDEYWEQEGE